MHEQAYEPDVDECDLAAADAFGLARGHCFADGNQRVALATTLMFLELNGLELGPDIGDDGVVAAILRIAEGT